jgi:hypothetical protein
VPNDWDPNTIECEVVDSKDWEDKEPSHYSFDVTIEEVNSSKEAEVTLGCEQPALPRITLVSLLQNAMEENYPFDKKDLARVAQFAAPIVL